MKPATTSSFLIRFHSSKGRDTTADWILQTTRTTQWSAQKLCAKLLRTAVVSLRDQTHEHFPRLLAEIRIAEQSLRIDEEARAKKARLLKTLAPLPK